MSPQRHFNNRTPVHMDPEHVYSSDSSADERLNREANDRRLRQAIAYLANEGGEDAPDTYVKRIQAIDKYLLKEYRAENYAFDRELYRQLRSMVREIQGNLDRIAESESEMDLMESEVSDIDTMEALYRDGDAADEAAEGYTNRVGFNDNGPGDKDATTLEKSFKYGGTVATGPEIWHKDFPAILPFGETIFMSEWENQRILFDLSEGKRKDGPVTSSFPYDLVSEDFHPNETTYESGSRFTLPILYDGIRRQSKARLQLKQTLKAFNNLGKTAHDKDKAPRIFLRKVSVHDPSLNARSAKGVPVDTKGKGRAVDPTTISNTTSRTSERRSGKAAVRKMGNANRMPAPPRWQLQATQG